MACEREQVKAAVDRAREQSGDVTAIDAGRIDAFARPMNEKLGNGDTNARMTYIRSLVDAVEVDDETIGIVDNKNMLQAAIAGK